MRRRSISPPRRQISPRRKSPIRVKNVARPQRRLSVTMNSSTFKQNLNSSMLPDASSIQCQGVFCEHFFNDGHTNQKKSLYNSYSTMEQADPVTGEKEEYILVSLNSIYDGLNHREPLNLVLVLDISGSMSGKLDDSGTSKMNIANEAIVEILKSLKQGEYFSIVLFDNRVEVLYKMTKIDDKFDMASVEKTILGITPRGSTNMEIGMSQALNMMKNHLLYSDNQNQNRIIFLTDACPNQGEDQKLIALTQDASKNSIYTTYIGVGLDFDTGFVNELTRTQGTNYFGISSKKEFQEILNTNFNYIVTPVSFNTKLLLESEYYCIDEVYGTAFEEEFKNDTVDLASQIASPKDEKLGKKGNMLLLKIKKRLSTKSELSKNIKMTLFYDTILRESIVQSDDILFDPKGNNAIEKAILLMKYVKMSHKVLKKQVNEEDFNLFIEFMKKQMETLNDEEIKNEVDLLVKLFKLSNDSVDVDLDFNGDD